MEEIIIILLVINILATIFLYQIIKISKEYMWKAIIWCEEELINKLKERLGDTE